MKMTFASFSQHQIPKESLRSILGGHSCGWTDGKGGTMGCNGGKCNLAQKGDQDCIHCSSTNDVGLCRTRGIKDDTGIDEGL